MASVVVDEGSEGAQHVPLATEANVTGRKKRRRKRKELVKVKPEEVAPVEPSRREEEPTLGETPAEEKPIVQAEAPPEPERTIEPPARPATDEDRVYAYLTEHGATRTLKIAKDLNLSMPAVLSSLRALKKQGKVHLR